MREEGTLFIRGFLLLAKIGNNLMGWVDLTVQYRGGNKNRVFLTPTVNSLPTHQHLLPLKHIPHAFSSNKDQAVQVPHPGIGSQSITHGGAA